MCKIKIIQIIIFIAFLAGVNVNGQTDYGWWIKIHHWDGHTSWLDYLKYSSKYFGPNALPVPDISKGVVGITGTVEIAADGYFSKGDNTQDCYTKVYYPVVGKLIAIEGYVVPFEHFKMDTATRDIRAARIKSGEGTAGGDIYFGTVIQLVKNKKFPDVAFRMTCRTASGTDVSAARYTNAPGYFFDLSMGKDFKNDKFFFSTIRLYGMIGFYCWQTNLVNYMQDDSFLYGVGVDLSSEKIIISASAGGYIGYIKDGDRPAVARLSLFRKGNHFNYGLSGQAGLNDYYYNSIRISLVYNMPEIFMIKKDKVFQ
jgi:hypothetical protein